MIIVRDVFQLKVGKAKDAKAPWKELISLPLGWARPGGIAAQWDEAADRFREFVEDH